MSLRPDEKSTTPEPEPDDWQQGVGDMSPEQFRTYGHQVVDWVAEYFNGLEQHPVLSQVRPGQIASSLPSHAPDAPEPMSAILGDFDRLIMPGITHWNHPAFFAYFAITGSAPGILGEFLAAALNVNAMLWRTSPAATELESVTLDWLRRLLGLPDSFEGVIYDTASISSLVAIAAARQATGLGIREQGMAGRNDLPALRLYCSSQAHSSIEKDAITLGIGQDNVRKIGTDQQFRMRPDQLRQAIEDDLRAGHRPFCVVATVGTTSTTSIDPVPEIADLCRQHDLWLHVDAAYGGVAAIDPEMRWVLNGVERADSVVVNPHKWLFTPVDLSTFFTRHLDAVADAFTLIPAYLHTPEHEGERNYMNYGPQLGRRFRALKLWFVLRAYGREGIVRRLREHLRLAQLFAQLVLEGHDWEVMAPIPFSTVCFRAHPRGSAQAELNELNQNIEDAVNASGEVFVAHTMLGDALTLRLAIGNVRTEERHVLRTWELLQGALHELRA